MLTYADLQMDEEAHKVRRAGQLIELTPTEYKLLHYLLANARRVLTRDQILEHVWGTSYSGFEHSLEQAAHEIRSALNEPGWIETVRGIGYRFVTKD